MTTWCKTEAPAQANRSLCKWNHLPIRWAVREVPDEFGESDYVDIVRNAFALWEAVSGLRTVEDQAKPNIIFLASRLDGRNGVLAEAQLPCGNVGENTQLWCRVDVSENWASYQGPLHSGLMDVFRVLAHEIGHNLGISHETTGASALMDPSVSSIRSLQQWDMQQAVARYGAKQPGGGGDNGMPPLQDCLGNLCNEDMADALNFGWEAFKRRLSKQAAQRGG